MQRFYLFSLLLLLSSQVTAGNTFGELAENCKTAVQLSEAGESAIIRKDWHAMIQAEKCWTYLNSFQEALAWLAIKQASQETSEPDMKKILEHLPFCVPDSVSIKQQALMITNHAERNPAHAKWPAAAVFGEIMLKQYPCK